MDLKPPSNSQLNANGSAVNKYQSALHSSEGFDALHYLTQDRGLSEATIRRHELGYVADPESGHEHVAGRIVIPYLTPSGPVKLRFRAVEPYTGKAKYLDLAGGRPRMFNTQALINPGNTLYIAEGEMDTMIAGQCGLPAVGIAGAQNWLPHFKHMLDGFSTIKVLADNDDGGAGMELANKIALDLDDHGVTIIKMPTGMDVNAFYNEQGTDALLKYVNH